MDGFWERVFWFLIVGACTAMAWIAKSIIKPWSDAALMRAQAFNALVEGLRVSLPGIQTELMILKRASNESSVALGENTEAAKVQTEAVTKFTKTFEKYGSDPFAKMCQAKELQE